MIDDISENAAAFGRALDTLTALAMDSASQIVRKALVDVSGDIVDDTPHDTGRARAGWMLARDNPPEEAPTDGEYPAFMGDAPSHRNVSNVQHSKSWEWWIANNVEYIEKLENGSSRQSPTGMVANALGAFASHISKHTKRFREWE
jgi:hypothetical protein